MRFSRHIPTWYRKAKPLTNNAVRVDDVQFEERVGNLEHEDVGVPVVVHNEDSFDRSPHTEVLIVVLQTLQACRHRWVFFGLRLLRANERRRVNVPFGRNGPVHT